MSLKQAETLVLECKRTYRNSVGLMHKSTAGIHPTTKQLLKCLSSYNFQYLRIRSAVSRYEPSEVTLVTQCGQTLSKIP